MVSESNWDVELADDIDVEADAAASNPVFVARCVDIAMVRRNGRTQLHQAWEPLSFKQVFNRAKYDFRKDDYTHDWLTSHTKDGKLMGKGTAFGQVAAAWEALGIPLTRNEVFRPAITGGIFTVTRVRDEWVPKDAQGNPQLKADGTPDTKYTYYVKPLEKLESYTPPANPKVQRYGFEASGIEEVSITPQQASALKSATNGAEANALIDALIDSGNNMIICEPFMSEAGSGALVERLEGLGARIVNGRVYFAEVAN